MDGNAAQLRPSCLCKASASIDIHDDRGGHIIGAGNIITLLQDWADLSQPPGTSSWHPKTKVPPQGVHVC
jgi:hypothetical protein